MNEISTTLYKVNWEYLINNCLNQNFWKNNWKIFEVDGITITLTIYKIDIWNNQITFKLDGKDYDTDYISIPLNANHFNKEVFNNSLYNACRHILVYKEYKLIRYLDEYVDACQLDRDHNKSVENSLRDEALDVLFEGLTFDDLNSAQDEAIESYVDSKHRSSSKNEDELVERLKYNHKPSWFGLLALTLGKPEDYDAWLKEQPSVGYADVVEDTYDHIDIENMEEVDD